MEFHQLRYFCAIVRTGTFTRAAESEHVAQPSLSQQILKLENELGGKLFARLPRGVRLTPLGELFLPRALAILQEIRDAKADIHQMVLSTSSQPERAPAATPINQRFARAAADVKVKKETRLRSFRKSA